MSPPGKTALLIVDDDSLIRNSLSGILTGIGYRVRSAEDGFSALVEIRNENPQILLSDLNMPGMSGFELLSVVRSRFPAIRVIAMSGTFFGSDVPPGIIADAFYEKGSSPRYLLPIVEAMARSWETLASPQRRPVLTPVWVPAEGHQPPGEAYVMITCQECLRTFPQVLSESHGIIHQTSCVSCDSLVHYAIVPPTSPASLPAFQLLPK